MRRNIDDEHDMTAKPKHNSGGGLAAKIALRERALVHVGGPELARVVDLFCGPVGAMHRSVWSRASSYLGVDVVYRWPDRRARIVAPWELALEHVPMGTFNVFDLDAFGSPWPALHALTRWRRVQPGERVAIITTDGGWRATRTHSAKSSDAALVALGVQPPRTLREMRPAAESAHARAARAMGARLDGLAIAGYSTKLRAVMGYAVSLLTGE